jgi:hypothetical protein
LAGNVKEREFCFEELSLLVGGRTYFKRRSAEAEGWIQVAQVRDTRRAVVNIRMTRIPCWPDLSLSIVLDCVCVSLCPHRAS